MNQENISSANRESEAVGDTLIYICFESHSPRWRDDCNTVRNMVAFDSPDKVFEWFQSRIAEGIANAFVLDEQHKCYIGRKEYNADLILSDIIEGKASLNMFLGFQDNWNEHYAIRAKRSQVR